MSDSQKSRRRFLADMLFVGAGLTAAGLLAKAQLLDGGTPSQQQQPTPDFTPTPQATPGLESTPRPASTCPPAMPGAVAPPPPARPPAIEGKVAPSHPASNAKCE